MKVAVLGGGVVGTTTAYMLSKAGCEVVVIDRCERPGMETSFANGGLMAVSDSSPWNSPGTVKRLGKMLFGRSSTLKINPGAVPSMLGWGLRFLANSTWRLHRENMISNIRLAKLSLDTLRSIRETSDLRYDKTTRGTMRLFPRGGRMNEFVQMCIDMQEWGVHFQTLDRSQILALEPCLTPVIDRYVGAVFFPHDESGDAHKFTNEMARLAIEHGATFLLGTDVHSVSRASPDKISHVATSAGDICADHFILSLGSYSPKIARQIGIKLPIIPVKGYSVTVPLNGWQGGPSRPIMDDGYHAMLVPMGDRLRMGGRAEFAGYDTRVDAMEGRRVFDDAIKILPELARHVDGDAVMNWAGLRPMTPGGPPFVGPTRYKNLFLNTGQGPLGWTMACGSARLIVDYITHGRVIADRVNPDDYTL